MPKGIFPNMNIPEIITALGGWGLSVRAEQLTHPTADFVEGVYCACLQQVTGITFDSLRDPVTASLSSLGLENEQDLYSAAFLHNLILYHLTRFAKAAQVEDFSAKDLYAPEKARTLVLLSAFINFVKFTEQFCDQFVKDQRDHSEKILVEREEVAEEVEKVQHEVDAVKAKLAEDEPQCDILKRENDILRTKMFEIKNSQAQAVSELEKLKSEKDTLVRQREYLAEEIVNTTDAVQRTQGRVVQSPDRIKKRISQMTLDATEDKRAIAVHEVKARDLQNKVNALLVIEKDLRGCVEQLHTIEKEVRLLQDAQKKLGDAKDQLEIRAIEKSELQLKRERVHKQLTNAHEKLERAQRHAEDKRQANEKTIARLKAEYEQMAIERRDNDKQLEELRVEASKIQTEMADHLKKSEAELNELLAEYWRLRHSTDVYMETLANKLNMRVTSG
ncbi:putative kinetochore protein NUF2 [Leucoagaricus sp. SymC.cos]|nr:putative kinetochore protein NUF2 [Leucoagaricus sp. SymC.cos]